ncbi:8-oxoguanine deaminase [Actinophytocola gossypii]|uniref:8-oxoguanine deaminase n=1 Tax=Actinophytocola gossypii TaxID=2812003 RepID=A0ABT2J7K9_9PSEU|nr:8-oxoguanine deaminase [Actinophytocola gossypii]MCT2583830.1 8-oxoguanine deaminase [Actinophytocola gossypii]
MRTVIENAAVVTVTGEEYAPGHLVADTGVITSVGAGPAPEGRVDRYIDGTGCLVTPGLVNTHHHLYQWATRGLAQQSTLFEWLTELYPVWAGVDEQITHAASLAGILRLALTGCTTVADHHYVYPRDGGDLPWAIVDASAKVGTRLHLVRGSMDRGESDGGLPPDSIVEDIDEALAGTADAIDSYHNTEPDAFVRVAVGPCSPFTVTEDLMRETAALGRDKGVRLHTHLAETLDEERQCLDEHGCTPVEYAERTGWLGDDVWLAHGVHLSDSAIARVGATGTGVAHCPTSNGRLGTGIARAADLLTAGGPVGLGVDGAASNEDGGLVGELRAATYAARATGGPAAMSARDALGMATIGGARCLGREDELGSLEVGKLADIAVWRVDGLAHAGITDPVAALVFGAPPPLVLLLAGGRVIVRDGSCATASEEEATAMLRRESARLLAKAGR